MTHQTASVVAGCLLALAACTSSPAPGHVASESELATDRVDTPTPPEQEVAVEETTPLEAPLEIVLSPGDLTTAFRGNPTLVIPAERLTEEDVAEIERRTTLVSWPAGEPLRATFSYEPAHPELGINQHRFEVQPARALATGEWLALQFDVRGTERFRPSAPQIDGIAVARFRADSHPVVRGVSFSPGDEEVGVTVYLSERVSDDRGAEAIVTVLHEGTELPCVAAPGDALASDQGAQDITVQCPLFPLESDVTVRVAPDLRTRAGTRVEVPFGDDRLELTVNPIHDLPLQARADLFRAGPAAPTRPEPVDP